MDELYVRQVSYILDNIERIDDAIAESEKEFTETKELIETNKAIDALMAQGHAPAKSGEGRHATEVLKDVTDMVWSKNE